MAALQLLEKSQAEARTNPEETFNTPAQLAAAVALTPRQRIDALNRWEQSVQDRLAASNEGMPTNNTTGGDLDLLSQIEKARKRLQSGRW